MEFFFVEDKKSVSAGYNYVSLLTKTFIPGSKHKLIIISIYCYNTAISYKLLRWKLIILDLFTIVQKS